jgi:hypothetical protein
MTPPAPSAPDHRRWLADGVRQRILLRALPAQRHDVLGPLSAMRLALSLVKTRLAADPPEVERVRAKVGEIEEQLAAAIAAVKLLRLWDGGRRTDALAACADCVAMLRVSMALRGHQLAEPAVRDGAVPPQLPCPDAHYAILGLLLHAQDTAAVRCLLAPALTPHGLRLEATPLPGVSPLVAPPPAGPEPRPSTVEAEALGWLVEEIGWRVARDDAGWLLAWAAPG